MAEGKFQKQALSFLKERQDEYGLVGFNDVLFESTSSYGFEIYAVCWSGSEKDVPCVGRPIYIMSNGIITDFAEVVNCFQIS